MKSTHPHTLLRLVLATGLALLLGSASAADFTSTWNGGTANWSSTGNWTTPGAPGTFPNNGAFTYDAVLNAGTASLTGDITVKQLTLNGSIDINGSRTLSLDGLTGSGVIDNNGFTGGAPVTVQVGNNNTSSSFGGIIKNAVGSITLTKVGTGTLTLSGANTFTGTTNLFGGTLRLGASNALPSQSYVAMYNAVGATTLDLNGFDNTLGLVWMGGLAGSTTNIETGTGTLTIAPPNTAVSDIRYSSGSGNGSTINGNLKLGNSAFASIKFGVADDTAVTNELTINATMSSSQGVQFFKDGAGTLVLAGSNNTFGYDSTAALGGDTIIREGTLKLGASNVIPDGTGYGRIRFGTPAVAGAKLDMAGFSDTINALNSSSPATGIVDNSTGTSTLTIGAGNNSSSYRGTIINSGGTLNITKIGTASLSYPLPTTLHTYTGVTTLSGGNFQVSALANGGSASHLGASSSAASNLVFDGGTLVMANLGNGVGSLDTNRLFTVTPNGGGITSNATTPVNFTSTGAYVFSGTGNRTLTLQGSNTGANTLAGTISNPSSGTTGVTKAQAGTWVLSGANTYSGTTTVNAGTLTATGSSGLGATTGALSVNNTNTGAGTAVVLNLSTTSPTTKGSLSGSISTPSSGTNTATINNGGQLLTINQTVNGSYAGTIAGTGGFTLGSLSTETLILSGVNTYTGLTTVQNGRLAFTGGVGTSTLKDFSLVGGTLQFDVPNFTLGSSSHVSGSAPGTLLNWTGDTLNINGTFTGATLYVSGTVNVGSSATFEPGFLTIAGGTLNTSKTFSAPLLWITGTMTGGGAIDVADTFDAGFFGGTLSYSNFTINTGNGLRSGFGDASLSMGADAVFNNGGTFRITSAPVSIATGAAFHNTGIFEAAVYAGSRTLGTAGGGTFDNSGTVNVETGTLVIQSADLGSTTGQFNVSSGATLRFNNNLTLAAGSQISGVGNVEFTGGTFTIDGGTANFSHNVTIPTLNLASGTLAGTGDTTVSGNLSWTGGTFSGTGALNVSGGGNTITSAVAKGLDRTLNNTGTITYSSPDTGIIQFGTSPGATGVINNSGTFNITNGGGFQILNANAGHAINNSGNWNVSGSGTAVVNDGIKFNNSGAVTVANNSTFVTLGGGAHTGSFTVGSGGDLWLTGGSDLNSGSSVTGAGRVTLGGTTINSGSTYNTTGETHLRGGITTFNTSATTGTVEGGNNQTHLIVSGATTKLTVNGAFNNNTEFTTLEGGAIIETTAFNLSGGELNGNGSINGPFTATGTGTIAPGASPGHITVNGSTVLGGSNTLAMEVGGLAAGIDYDLLTVNGILTLGGLLDVDFINGFENSVQPTDIFTIATSTSSILGAFSNVASGGQLVTNFSSQFRVYYGAGSPYGANNLVLTELEAVPEPSRAVLMLGGLLGVIMRRRRR